MTRVGVVACGALAVHIRAIARRRGFDVDVYPIDAVLHNRPERIAPAVSAQLERLRRRYDRLAVAYGDCGSHGALDEALRDAAVARLAGENCYEMFAGAAGIAAALEPRSREPIPDRLPGADLRAHGDRRARARPPPRAAR